jgi:hypothetical protein
MKVEARVRQGVATLTCTIHWILFLTYTQRARLLAVMLSRSGRQLGENYCSHQWRP